MNNLCCICLGNIKEKSLIQKCFDIKKSCECHFFMHNSCFFDFINHKIKKKKDIECIMCKSKIVTYKTCMIKTKKFHDYVSKLFQKFIIVTKVIVIVLISRTFLKLLHMSITFNSTIEL